MKKLVLLLALFVSVASTSWAALANPVRIDKWDDGECWIYLLLSSDSLAAAAAANLDHVRTFGASKVVFWWGHHDSTGSTSFYQDSLSGGTIQTSANGTNFINLTADAEPRCVSASNSTLINQTNSGIENTGASAAGGRWAVFAPYVDADEPDQNFFACVPFMRFSYTVATRFRCADPCTGNAAMYRPFVKVFVYYGAPPPHPIQLDDRRLGGH